MSDLPDLPALDNPLLPTGCAAKAKRLSTGSSAKAKRLSTGSSVKVKRLSTGSSVKVKRLSTGSAAKVKRLFTGSFAREENMMKEAAGLPALPPPDAMLSIGGSANVKKVKTRGETDVDRHFPWRREAKSDLPEVARFYGADLASLEARPMGIEEAKAVFREQGAPIRLLMTADGGYVRECQTVDIGMTSVVFWEIFAGSCNLTKAVVKKCQSWPATGGEQAAVLPPVEIDENRLSSTPWNGLQTWDVCSPSQRRLTWAYLTLLQPRWVHLAPPCTFWSPLSRRCNRRAEAENERMRVEALAFLVFSLQVCNFQRQRQRFFSLEQPPHCVSWKLDIVQQFTERELATGSNALEFASCAWGHTDPGNGKLFLKRQRFFSNAHLIGLSRRCTCNPRAHQRVEGSVESGGRRGMRRSTIAGEYPVKFCEALVVVMIDSIRT